MKKRTVTEHVCSCFWPNIFCLIGRQCRFKFSRKFFDHYWAREGEILLHICDYRVNEAFVYSPLTNKPSILPKLIFKYSWTTKHHPVSVHYEKKSTCLENVRGNVGWFWGFILSLGKYVFHVCSKVCHHILAMFIGPIKFYIRFIDSYGHDQLFPY